MSIFIMPVLINIAIFLIAVAITRWIFGIGRIIDELAEQTKTLANINENLHALNQKIMQDH